jgi:hypothetical protein
MELCRNLSTKFCFGVGESFSSLVGSVEERRTEFKLAIRDPVGR